LVFLDASAIIYLLEGRAEIRQAARAVLAKLAEAGVDPGLAVSSLSRLECRVHPMRNEDRQRLSVFDTFFADPGLVMLEIDRHVIDLATRLRAEHGIRTPDALQAASCLQFDPNMPFVTGDRDFHRVAGLNLHPIE
jgi:predicted nucleic acid-binding protein